MLAGQEIEFFFFFSLFLFIRLYFHTPRESLFLSFLLHCLLGMTVQTNYSRMLYTIGLCRPSCRNIGLYVAVDIRFLLSRCFWLYSSISSCLWHLFQYGQVHYYNYYAYRLTTAGQTGSRIHSVRFASAGALWSSWFMLDVRKHGFAFADSNIWWTMSFRRMEEPIWFLVGNFPPVFLKCTRDSLTIFLRIPNNPYMANPQYLKPFWWLLQW